MIHMKTTIQTFTFCAACFSASLALGHGVQIQITHDAGTGRIVTREIVHTDSRPTTISDAKRVYVMPLRSLVGGAGDGWYTRPDATLNIFGVPNHPTGPGLAFEYDEAGQLPGTGWAYSGSVTRPNLQNTNFAYLFESGLKAWDGVSFVDADSEELQSFRGDGTSVPTITATSSDSGPFVSLPMSNIGSKSSNPHHSVGFRILGDGLSSGLTGAAAGDDGVYLASFSITSTAAGVLNSEPIYSVMYKNAPPADAMDAAEALGLSPSLVQVIPEPATFALLTPMLASLLLRRRRSA